MSFISRKLALSAALLLLPLASQAATVTYINSIQAGEDYSFAAVMKPKKDVEFRFNVLDDLVIPVFAASGTGNSGGIDLGTIRFGFTYPGSSMFTTILTTGTSTFGGGFLAGRTFQAGDQFSVFFSDGVRKKVALTLSFLTQSPSQVPLPAPGLLLAAALGAIAAFTRRKQTRAAVARAV